MVNLINATANADIYLPKQTQLESVRPQPKIKPDQFELSEDDLDTVFQAGLSVELEQRV